MERTIEHFEFMNTILDELADELAMEEDFDEEDPFEGLDPEDEGWDEPSYDLDMGFNPYMGCYDFDC